MSKDLWLPNSFVLFDGTRIKCLLFSGIDWQIYNSYEGNNILVVRPALSQKWCDAGLIESSLLHEVIFGSITFRALFSKNKYVLSPVENGKSPDSKVDAIAFSLALRDSRKIAKDVSFHDSVYVEQYSRLLPSWTLTPKVSDEIVLGTWISGGVVISTASFRRLSHLASWMSSKDLSDIISAAGFNTTNDEDALTIQKTDPHVLADDKTTKVEGNLNPLKNIDVASHYKDTIFSLPGRPKLEDFFNEHIIDIIINAEKYKALGIESPSAIVLHGPPGCGKTFAVERLVDFLDWPSFSIDSNSVGSPYIHATSKKISEVFDKAIDSAPSVIVIDEMESFLSNRNSGGLSGLHHVEEVAEFLRRISEAVKHNVLIIAMTNMIETIDPAILRRGRFDHIIEVGMPSKIEVKALIDSLLSTLPKSDDIDIEAISDALAGKPLSDASFCIREAARLAAKSGKTCLDQTCIGAALKNLPDLNKNKIKHMGFGKKT